MNYDPIQRDREIKLSLENELPEQFTHLRQQLDKKRVTPESEIHQYEFSEAAILYTYPPKIRELLNLYESNVEKTVVVINTKPEAPAYLSITIYTDTIGIIEITSPEGLKTGASFKFDVINGPDLSARVEPEAVGNLLTSLALSPDDCTEIQQAKANNTATVPLDPRDPYILHLLKNSLDSQATSYSVVQQYKLTHTTPYNDAPLKTEITITKNSDGSECYDATFESYYIEDGYASTFLLSSRCFTDRNSEHNEITAHGSRRVLTADEMKTEQLDDTSVTAFAGSVITTLAGSI